MLGSLILAALLGAASTGPIVVDECSFVPAGSFEHSVAIRFHNTSPKTATVVTFEIHNGPHSVSVADHGSFATGVSVDHKLTTPTWELHHAQPHTCAVTSVRFADGSSWHPTK